LPETLMIADIHKPDISTLLTTGHFYFGWTPWYRSLELAATIC
jgi:hypothetical protein